jgi:N-acetylneuraminate synthase
MSIFIIAEIGINHNGDMAIAKQLIDAASDAGFDAVKFQKRTIDKVYTKEFFNFQSSA